MFYVLAALLLCLCLLPATALADSTSGACGDNLTWTLADSVLTINGTAYAFDANGYLAG